MPSLGLENHRKSCCPNLSFGSCDRWGERLNNRCYLPSISEGSRPRDTTGNPSGSRRRPDPLTKLPGSRTRRINTKIRINVDNHPKSRSSARRNRSRKLSDLRSSPPFELAWFVWRIQSQVPTYRTAARQKSGLTVVLACREAIGRHVIGKKHPSVAFASLKYSTVPTTGCFVFVLYHNGTEALECVEAGVGAVRQAR